MNQQDLQEQKWIKPFFIILLSILLCISIFINFQHPIEIYHSAEIDVLRERRDSTIQFQLEQSQQNEIRYHKLADSALTANKKLTIKDSTNHYYYAKEKAKIKDYAPAVRNAVMDSILRANGIK